ncbi:MAG: glycosyltransferase family 4 protein [Oceanospirillaceae bacterium]|nr:glycosyltransferase family 4 protein [Oceanospirillaceae bacterium]
MKIIYLHQYFNTPSMTGGTRSYEMARRLVENGHEVHMITSWRDKTDKKDWFITNEKGINVYWFPVPYSNRLKYKDRIRAFVSFAWKAAYKATEISADVVFATSTPLTIALPALFASRRHKIPMVFEVRDLWPELPVAIGALKNPVAIKVARWLEGFAYHNSTRIVALSPGMAQGIVEAGYPSDKVTVIPNSCDIELFDPVASDAQYFRRQHPDISDGPIVLYSGAFGKINGLSYMVRMASVALKAGSNLNFVAIGKGIEEELIRREAIQNGVLGENFHILQPVPKEEMKNVLAAADVALSLFIDLPEMWANSANKFFDAIASGTPVAINYRGWQCDLLEETSAGIVLPPDSPEQASQELVKFISDKVRLTDAGRAARQLAIESFDRNVLAKKLERVLIDAVS